MQNVPCVNSKFLFFFQNYFILTAFFFSNPAHSEIDMFIMLTLTLDMFID